MKISEALTQARELIRKGWCRGEYAKDAHNNEVDPLDPAASKFCAVGACRKVYGIDGEGFSNGEAEPAAQYLARIVQAETGFYGVPGFNDSKRNKRDVIRLFDRAIKQAEQDGV